MFIGIDGNEANQKIRTGSGVYAFELLKEFAKNYISDIKYKVYLKDKPSEELPTETGNWQYKIVGPKKLWTQIGLPSQLWKEKILGGTTDVFFTPSHYAPRHCPIPSVITIFDLSFIRFPEMFLKKDLYQLKNWTRYSVEQAKKIITISQFSKKEIVDYYKVDPENILVAYPGYDRNKFNVKIKNQKSKIKSTTQKFKINDDYILFVGTIQPRKNLERLIEAFSKLKTKNLKLVLAGMISEGRGGWMNENIKHRISKIKNDVILTGFIPDKELPYLVSGAHVLVLPSLYEGFGIPVIEAMACGVPVVVSNVSSLPEIVGEAAILVNPLDVDSIAGGIREACYNISRREVLKNRGLQQVKNYNWKTSANIILDTLKSLT